MPIRSLAAACLLSATALAFAQPAAADNACTPPGTPSAAPTAVQAICTFRNGFSRVRIADRWGFVDAEGRVAVAPQFDALDDFSEDLAAARRGALWGYVDPKGAWVIEPRFASAGAFAFKRALVTVDGKVGYIDETGRLVVPATYAEGRPFHAGVALVREADGTQVLIDERGGTVKRFERDVRVLPPNDFGLFIGEQGGLKGLLRPDGEWTIPPTAEPLPGDGRPYIQRGQGAERYAIDIAGRVSKPAQPIGLPEDWPNWWTPRVENAGTDQEATVFEGFDFRQRLRVPHRVLPGQSFMDGVLVVEPFKPTPAKRLGLFNHEGQLLGLYAYDVIRPMKEGFSVVGRKTTPAKGGEPVWRYGALDNQGQRVTPLRFQALGDFSEERAVAISGGQLGLTDILGKLVMHSGFTCDGEAVLLDAKKRITWPASARKKKVCAAKT